MNAPVVHVAALPKGVVYARRARFIQGGQLRLFKPSLLERALPLCLQGGLDRSLHGLLLCIFHLLGLHVHEVIRDEVAVCMERRQRQRAL